MITYTIISNYEIYRVLCRSIAASVDFHFKLITIFLGSYFIRAKKIRASQLNSFKFNGIRRPITGDPKNLTVSVNFKTLQNSNACLIEHLQNSNSQTFVCRRRLNRFLCFMIVSVTRTCDHEYHFTRKFSPSSSYNKSIRFHQ